jgi:hypothetical protein
MGLFDKFFSILIENGLNWLIKPAQIDQNGIAEAHVQRRKMLIETKTENDIREYKQGLIDIDDNGDIIPKDNIIKSMLIDEKMRIIHKKSNLINTVKRAYELLEEESSLSQEYSDNVDANWFNRWREEAENADTEEVQYLWAKIINQEIRNPSSVSLRTLDFIRNLSKDEALLIEKIISCSFMNFIFFDVNEREEPEKLSFPDLPDEENSFLIQNGIYQNQLQELKELGIIDGVGFGGVAWDLPTTSNDMYIQRLKLNRNIITITKRNRNTILQFSAYTLTKRGIE